LAPVVGGVDIPYPQQNSRWIIYYLEARAVQIHWRTYGLLVFTVTILVEIVFTLPYHLAVFL